MINSQATPPLRLVAWEVTRACNLACRHCRAEAHPEPFPGQLNTAESQDLIDQIARIGQPILIFTGGEPLLRPDIFELVSYADAAGLRCVMAPNGTLVTPENADRMRASGIQRASISIDGPDAASHDDFRGVPGAFASALKGIDNLKEAGLPFQINTTVSRQNFNRFKDIFDLAVELGASAWHIFLLVPTGRAASMNKGGINAEEYEQVLNWFYDFRRQTAMELKATCAPHYHRILRQRATEDGIPVTVDNLGLEARGRGCLGGQGFCFISHTGQVQPCGYLELDCGQIRQTPLADIWANSEIFAKLRNQDCYSGKCSVCEYHSVCGGCRARALTMNGDYLAEEPLCTYQPQATRG